MKKNITVAILDSNAELYTRQFLMSKVDPRTKRGKPIYYLGMIQYVKYENDLLHFIFFYFLWLKIRKSDHGFHNY